MKILMISTDEKIFEENSEVRNRMKDYGNLVDELHIVVKSPKNKNINFDNVFVYSTKSRWSFFYFWDAYKIGKSIIAKPQTLNPMPWLVTTQDPFETGLIGYLLKRKFRIPLQIQIHTDFLSPYFWRESLKNKIRVLLGKWLVKKADGIRVVSERIKNSLSSKLQVPSSKITVLPIFVDIEKIKNASIKTDLRQKYPGRFIILMASRLTQEKNIGLAVESVKNLIPNHPNLLLLIVGSGPERENLKSQISNLKLQDNVFIENWSDDLSSYYKTADLFLLTSNYEGYGRTVIEAVAAGLPVVMVDVGIAWGKVVPVGNKNELMSAIKSLVENDGLRRKIVDNQNIFLSKLINRDEFLNNIKESWLNCFS